MNDSREFIDAMDHADALIDLLAAEWDRVREKTLLSKAQGTGTAANRFHHDLRSGLKSFLVSINPFISGPKSAFVISFTDDSAAVQDAVIPGDRLSQWRAYGGGRGISLGFDFEALHGKKPGESWNAKGGTAYLLDCLYSAERKQEILRSIAPIVIPKFVQYLEAGGPEAETHLREFRMLTILGWVINASTFKAVTFSEEREWRIVILGFMGHEPGTQKKSSKSTLKFRSGPMGVTPYLDYRLDLSKSSSALRRVVVGPTPHLSASVEAVRMALTDRGVKLKSEDFPNGVEVVSSRIPFRNW